MKKTHFLIIAGLFLLYGITNYFWLLQNKLLSYDEGIHLWTSLRFVRAFIQPAHNILYELFHANTTHWPPLFYFIAGLFNLVFGASYVASVMTNMLFFFLLIVSLYLIGKKIYTPEIGILSSVIVSLYPIVYGHSRLFQLDFALTAVVTFSIYCLISTDRFKNLRWSIIFAVSAGLGMLIKWSYLFFVGPLFLYISISALRDINKKEALNRAGKVFLVLSIALLTGPAWYLMQLAENRYAIRDFIRVFSSYAFKPLEELEWIILVFNNAMLSFIFFLLFIICLIFFYARVKSRYKFFITMWYLVPLLLLICISWKQARFFMPILPCLALISASSMVIISHRKLKSVIIIFIIAAGLIQFFNVSFNKNINKSRRHGNIDIFYRPYVEDYYSIVGAASPYATDWKHEDIARSFSGHIQEFDSYPFSIGVIYEYNDAGLYYLFCDYKTSYYISRELVRSDVVFLGDVDRLFFPDSIQDKQGILYISRERKWPDLDDIDSLGGNRPLFDSLLKDPRFISLINSTEKFRLIDRIALPDNYYANLYLCNISEARKDDIVIKAFNGRIKIFYKGREITKGLGITSKVVHNSVTYGYGDAVWDIYNISTYQIKMNAYWPGLGIRQSTLISIDPEKKNILDIKIELESEDNVILDDWYINSLISNKYKEWTRPFSKGVFKEITIFQDPYKYEPLDLDYNGPPVVGVKENTEKGLPAVLFRCSNTEVPIQAGVSNTNYNENARCVYVTTQMPIRLNAGSPLKILDLNISILSDPGLEKITLDRVQLPDGTYKEIYLFPKDIPELQKDDITVKIFNGRAKIYYKDKEITKGTGISFKFTRDNKTYGYSDIVSAYVTSPHEARIVSKLPGLGITQSTSISMDPDKKNTINVKVELESKNDIEMDNWFININNLISNQYKEWIRPFSKGVFKTYYNK